MTYTREQALADLDAVYAQMPDVNGCTGECWRTCHNISAAPIEQARIQERGFTLPDRIPSAEVAERERSGEQMPNRCPALSAFGLCRVYDVRPFVCRLWGATHLPRIPMRRCPQGCTPDRNRWLTHEDAVEINRRIDAISVRYYRENPGAA